MHPGACPPRIPVHAHPISPHPWCSPVSVWRSGSTATLWQTSARRLAAMSLTSLCLSERNPLYEQLKACSTVKCFPQTQLPGRWISCHQWRRLSASWNAPICKLNLCSVRGSTPSQIDAPFSLPKFIDFCRSVKGFHSLSGLFAASLSFDLVHSSGLLILYP